MTKSMVTRSITIGPRLIAPLIGALLSIVAYLAQNVWNLFHIDDVSHAVRSLDRFGILASFFIIGAIEGTVLLCFYLPGTAIVILILLGLQPTWIDALPLLSVLMAGTLAGYGISIAIGRTLQERLPALVGPATFGKVRTLIERFGAAAFAVCAIHPNQLALAFAMLGYFKARRAWAYLLVALTAQGAWWAVYASTADLFSRQTVVTGSNFQLYLVGLFSAWFVYELISSPQPS